MIVLANVIEPKAASANSVYPAVIAYVQTPNTGSQIRLQNLTFYCPATMSGHPSEAILTANSCNIVEAPVYPHENADPYNYQRGDVIMISYADGNLSSPQFVRYVPISDDVRTMNCSYLDGAPIVQDGLLQLVSPVTIESDILKKAYRLLTPMKLCAMGDINATAKMIQIDYGLDNPFSDNVVYKKISRYGVELFRTGNFDTDARTLDGAYQGDVRSPYISFLAIVSYLLNNAVIIKDNTEIVKITNKALEETYESEFTKPLNIDEKNALVIFALLAGYPSGEYDSYGSLISATIYNSDNKSKPQLINGDLDLAIVSAFGYPFYFPDLWDKDENAPIQKFYINEWYNFIYGYQKELDRAYTIILHNNIWRLKSVLGVKTFTISLLLSAIIATAYPILEKTVLNIDLLDNEENGSNYKEYLTKLREWAVSGETSGIENNVYAYRSAIGNDVGRLVCYRLNNKWGDSEDEQFVNLRENIKNNVVACIENLIRDKDYILNLFNQNTTSTTSSTTTGSSSSQTATLPEATIPNTVFTVWPCPPHKTISAPYGENREGKIHKGVDICSNNGTFRGTPIYTMSGGTVLVANTNSNNSTGWGCYVKIQHTSRFSSLYAHMDSVLVRAGEKVLAGQQIGTGGSTGQSTGPHLHLEIYDNEHNESDKRVNALAYISIPNF